MRKGYLSAKHTLKHDHDIDLSFSSILNSEISQESFTEPGEKYNLLNNTLNRRSHNTLQTPQEKYKNHSILERICIGCEKKQKIISDLQYSIENDKSQIILTEKHLKQYDELLKIKDKRLQESESALELQKCELEKQKIELSSVRAKLENEQRKMYKDKQELNKKLQELELKKGEIESLLQNYLIKKTEYMNTTENHESESTNNTEGLLFKRDEEIQRLMDEVTMNKNESVYGRRCNTVGDYSPEKQDEELELKKMKLNKLEMELIRIKQGLIFEKEEQERSFKEQLILIRNSEKKMEKEKLKLVEGQKLIQMEIQSINRIKNKLKLSSHYEVPVTKLNLRYNSPDSILPKGSRTQENTFIVYENEDLVQSKQLDQGLKIDHLKQKIFSLKSSQKELEQQILEYKSQHHQWLTEKAALTDSLQKKSSEISELQQKLSESCQTSQKTVAENMLKLKIGQLENLISVEGERLQSTLVSVQKQCDFFKQSKEKLELENNELLNKCQNLEFEKEKFRKISESLHNQLNGIKSEDSGSENSDSSEETEIKGLKFELKAKLDQLKQQEKNLLELGLQLKQEKSDINKAVEYIQSINHDLTQQRQELESDQASLKSEKLRLSSLNKHLEEKYSMLTEKEQEIFNLKSKLEERERLIHSHSTIN